MLFYLFYFGISPFLFLTLHILKNFNKKIKIHIRDESQTFVNVLSKLSKIDRTKINVLIFHAASAGEFEQLKPILKRINRKKYFIIQTFTSPSVYNKELKNTLFDISCYHPYDLWWKSYKFFSTINPQAYIITRHDIWPMHLFITKMLNIKTFYINANLHNKSIWLYPVFIYLSKSVFKKLYMCLVPSIRIKNKLKKIITSNKIIITGDSRFDQVIERAQSNRKKQYLSEDLLESFNIIFGSYDINDESLIINSLKNLYTDKEKSLQSMNHRIILAPHEVDTKTISRIEKKIKDAGFISQLYLSQNKEKQDCRILIINSVGILADLYRYCQLAYVGAGFGAGVHSVIEPAIHKCAVGFGPNIELLDEAKDIYNNGYGIMIKNEQDMINFLKLYTKKEMINNLGLNIHKYIIEHKNVSNKIITRIEQNI